MAAALVGRSGGDLLRHLQENLLGFSRDFVTHVLHIVLQEGDIETLFSGSPLALPLHNGLRHFPGFAAALRVHGLNHCEERGEGSEGERWGEVGARHGPVVQVKIITKHFLDVTNLFYYYIPQDRFRTNDTARKSTSLRLKHFA